MNFLVVIKFITSLLSLGSIAFGAGAIIGTYKSINPFYKNLKKVDEDSQAAESVHEEAEKLLRSMGASENGINSLDQGELIAYYQIKKKQLDWIVKNQEWLKEMGIKIEDIIPRQYLFEKR